MVLCGEHLGGCQQRALQSRVHHLQHGAQSNDRLARSHLTLQEPAHRPSAGQVALDLLGDLLLPVGQLERQHLVEGGGDTVGHARAGRRRAHRHRVAPFGEHQLQRRRLVEAQTVARVLDVVLGLRKVHDPQCVVEAHQRVLGAHRLGQRILDAIELVQDLTHAA